MKVAGLSERQITHIIRLIRLHLPNVKIYAFGSRVTGTPRTYSDLDLALDTGNSITLSELTKIKSSLSETDIPIVIDIIDYCSVSSDFKSIIDKQKVEL